MKQIISLASLSFLTFLLVACGHKADDKAADQTAAPATKPVAEAPAKTAAPAPAAETAQLSCTNPSASQCTEFPGGDAGMAEQLCGAINGTFAKSPCTKKARLGGCELTGMHKLINYYPGGSDNLTAALAKEDCKSSGGTWQP